MIFDNKWFESDGHRLRMLYVNQYNKYFCFSMIYVISYVADIVADFDGRKKCEKYWKELKEKLSNENGIKIDDHGGDSVDIDTLQQVLEYIPGPRARKLSSWIRQTQIEIVGAEMSFDSGMSYYKSANYYEAFMCFAKAVELGHIEANYYLAICYQDGKGVEKNPEKAFEYALKAAEHGHEFAQQFIGDCYYYARGVAENMDKAYFWYDVASNNGYAEMARKMIREKKK